MDELHGERNSAGRNEERKAYRRRHGWDSGLMQMILINNGDVESLSFAREPVALNADDDLDEKKRSDYIHLANLIETVHGYYFLPDISRETSPDLERFDEKYIRKHYCLWGFKKRTYFMFTLDAKQKYVPFAKMISDEFDALSPFRFDIAYLNGFWNVYAHDPFMNKVINCRRSGLKPRKPPYKNSFAGFMKFIGNTFTQSLVDKEGWQRGGSGSGRHYPSPEPRTRTSPRTGSRIIKIGSGSARNRRVRVVPGTGGSREGQSLEVLRKNRAEIA
ncbi:hypothetical protein LguiA_033575 [Lonicera macranthoides]